MGEGFSGLSFNSGSGTFSTTTSPNLIYSGDMAFNAARNAGFARSYGNELSTSSSYFGGDRETPEQKAARLRQADIASSTARTKSEEKNDSESFGVADDEAKAIPMTSEAVETGSTGEEKEGGVSEAKENGSYTLGITESAAPLSSQIDNTSKDKKDRYEVPEYDLAGYKTAPFGLEENKGGGQEIENSVSAQARAKEGDTVNGKELKQSDIDWAKEKTDGTFTLGDLQRGNDLPQMPEINYTPRMQQANQQQQAPEAHEQTYELTTGQEGTLSQMETVPESPVVEMPEEAQGQEPVEQADGWKDWSDSQKETVDKVFGKDVVTPGGAALIQKMGVQDKFVQLCDDLSRIEERRAIREEVDDDVLNDTLTQVRELIEGLDDPKAMALTDNMGNAFSKEDSRAESELLGDIKQKMVELFPQMRNLDRLTDALDPQNEVQAVKDTAMKLGNSGVQALYRMTVADIDSTMMAADARYMDKEQQNEKLVEMARQNAEAFGEDLGKDITQNAFVGFLTGDHNLVDKAAASIGQGAWGDMMKNGIKFISYAEKTIGKKLAEKVHDIAVNGKDAVEELKNTCLDEIAHARGKAEPYINLAKGTAKILAGFAGLVITGGASAKLMLDGANDLANLSYGWQNAKLAAQMEGMQMLLEGMESIGLAEPNGFEVEEGKGFEGGINRLTDGGGRSPYTMGNIDPTGNGTSRYERKKKSLEGLNYNTSGAEGWNEGIGSEEEAGELYKNILRNDGAARRFVSDLQEAS